MMPAIAEALGHGSFEELSRSRLSDRSSDGLSPASDCSIESVIASSESTDRHVGIEYFYASAVSFHAIVFILLCVLLLLLLRKRELDISSCIDNQQSDV